MILLFSLLGFYAESQERNAIQFYTENPRYWQYKGEPVLLLGASDDDNLFQIPNLEEHLDEMDEVGANYIRNTMSSRDEGNVWPFAKVGEVYDLDQWNPEYWQRLETMLELTSERNIIVQLELWAIWDMFYDRWTEQSPWNPKNNKSYTIKNTNLKTVYGEEGIRPYKSGTMHDFYLSVPALSNDKVLLKYQQKFVDKILSYTLNYDHVLYTMTNEIFIQFSPEWGWYWSRYIKGQAAKQNKTILTTEMYQFPVIRHEQHNAVYDYPEIFDFVDISQNAGRYGYDENHWDNLRYVFDRTADHPRPINHVKMYGAGDDANEKYIRSVVGGAASIRFHRPTSGLGLNEQSVSVIKLLRKIEEFAKFWEMEPGQHLLSDRESDEAYLTTDGEKAWVIYFTNGGSVNLQLNDTTGDYLLKWFKVGADDWEYELPMKGEDLQKISAPARGGWIGLILKND